MRLCLVCLLVALVLVPVSVGAEEKPSTFPRELRSYLRNVVEDVSHLEKRKLAPSDKGWMRALHRQLELAEKLVERRPTPLALAKPLQEAHDAWARARRDTHTVYVKLFKAAETETLRMELRVRSRGLAIGYRNACRKALEAFTTGEALASHPDPVVRPPSPAKLEAPFDTGNSRAMCKLAAQYVRPLHRHEAREDAARLKQMKRGSILVVRGSFDHIGQTLDALRVPYTRVEPYRLKPETFKQHRIVLWGCGEPIQPSKMRRLTTALRRFVQRGGHLYTTDWAVQQVIGTIAPKYLSTPGPEGRTEEVVLEAEAPRAAADHPLLRGVLRPDVKTKVWFERAWFPASRGTAAPRSMKTLLVAPQLRELFQKDPMIAVTFPLGKGHVLHVVPMSYQQNGNLAGVMATQRLLLNFICQALRED